MMMMKEMFPGRWSSRRGTFVLVLLPLVGLHLIGLGTRRLGIFLSDTRDIFFLDLANQRHHSDSVSSQLLQQQQEFQYTPAQQCRLELEQWLNPQIDEFLQMGKAMPPLIDWVWNMGDHYVVNMRFHPNVKRNFKAFYTATWNW